MRSCGPASPNTADFKHNARAFVDLMTQMCEEFPGKQIVYRPHPSESLDDLDLSEKFSNFFIEQSYSIIPWLRSVSLTIFNYCTTGPEAQILGLSNIAYRPFKDEAIENDIPYRNSTVFENSDLLIDYIRQMSRGLDGDKSPKMLQFAEEISGLGSNWAVENIADELFDLLDGMPKFERTGIFARCRAWFKNRFSRETSYVMHKYGNVNTKLLNETLDRLPNFGAGDLKAIKIENISMGLEEATKTLAHNEKGCPSAKAKCLPRAWLDLRW